jgi:hypothetical protein
MTDQEAIKEDKRHAEINEINLKLSVTNHLQLSEKDRQRLSQRRKALCIKLPGWDQTFAVFFNP